MEVVASRWPQSLTAFWLTEGVIGFRSRDECNHIMARIIDILLAANKSAYSCVACISLTQANTAHIMATICQSTRLFVQCDLTICLLLIVQSMAAEAGDTRAEGNACVALAKAQTAAGDQPGARKAAERAVGLAEEEEDVQRLEMVNNQVQAELAFAA